MDCYKELRRGQPGKHRTIKLDTVEMRMLRWMCGFTRMDRVRNDRIRELTKVAELSKKEKVKMVWTWHEERGRLHREKSDGNGGGRKQGRSMRRWIYYVVIVPILFSDHENMGLDT